MKRKAEVVDCFKKFKRDYCDPEGIKIKEVQSDDEAVYVGPESNFRKYLSSEKIRLRSSAPYCHWENGVAERVIRTMMEKSFTLMAQRGLAPQYWSMCLKHVYMVNNYLPHTAVDNQSPYWRWYDKNPDAKKLHIFGCDCRVNIPIEQRKKYVEAPAIMGVYVGFNTNNSAHKIFIPSINGKPAYVKKVGDADAKFFELQDENLYLKTYTDPAYKKYLYNEATVVEDTEKQAKENKTVRVAKYFNSKLYFGTAKANASTNFPWDIFYDDGDFETVTELELEQMKALFKTSKNKNKTNEPPRNEPGSVSGVSLLQEGFELIKINDMKIVEDETYKYAAFNIDYKKHGVSFTDWAQADAVLALSGNRDDAWTAVRDFLSHENRLAV
jgi:hypothetical protein